MRERETQGVAIVGMAARFPGAPDLDTFRFNIEAGADAISEAPADRWDPVFYDPRSSAPDRLYCNRGGFLPNTIAFDAPAFGIMPVAAQGAEPDQLVSLQTAAQALADAGYADRAFARERTAVIVGRGHYLTPGLARNDQRMRTAEQLVRSLRALVPGISEEQLVAVKERFQAELGPFGPDTAIGMVPNLAASRIANRLDLGGPAYTVDAACASSLVAVDHAFRELLDGRVDVAIAGGVHLCHDPTFWSVLCQLGAVSRSQQIRPFDRRADGLLVGEGVGMVVLKRLADAERDGDRVYAVIRGTGVASDGRDASLMTPRVEGQMSALRSAWEQARLDPTTVGLIEAHGTGTPAGDGAELTTLARMFGPLEAGAPRAALGSVKSMIGHAMPAAGVAGLIKAALAIHHRFLPPTLHCEEPRAELAATRFELLDRARPWEARALQPRRAGVNAFGFGGINAHVVLEEHAARVSTPSAPRTASTRSAAIQPATGDQVPAAERALLLTAPSPEAMLALLDAAPRGDVAGDRAGASESACRLAVFNPTPERLARARKIVARGEASRGREDIWFAPRGLVTDGGRVAFLFPGVDASFEPRVDDVARRFDAPISLPEGKDLPHLVWGIITVSRLLDRVLRSLDVRPDVLAGHSVGEWTGMIASGMVPNDEVDVLIGGLASEQIEVPDVVFVAIGGGVDKAEAAIEGLPDIAVSHDNCPHQSILCGRSSSAAIAMERLANAGVVCQELPFRSGYHSPLFADYVGLHRKLAARIRFGAPEVPLWSATTCETYPENREDLQALIVDHLVRAVRFREVTERLYAEGARIFLQVGTGSLVGFVSDTLRGRPHLAMSANVPARSGIAQLRRTLAALWVEGATVALDRLDLAVATDKGAPIAATTEDRPRSTPKRSAPVALSLSVPLVELPVGLATPPAPAPAPASREVFDAATLATSPVAAELTQALRELTAAQGAVVTAWQSPRSQRAPLTPRRAAALEPREITEEREISLSTHPTLIDHAFYRQPEGWPSLADRYPVVPMTMLLSMMISAAERLVPELGAIGLENVRAYRWLAVEPTAKLSIISRFDGVDRVEVIIDGYTSGTIVMGRGYPTAPPPDRAPLAEEEPAAITASELYSERFMFHGPEYQGVVGMGAIGADGIRGTLTSLRAEGGLLDNAGQLLGYWVIAKAATDRMAMPVRLEQVRFFGPHPQPGERLECTVRVLDFGPDSVRADVELTLNGKLWVRIEGWEDKRFGSTERSWKLFQHPDRNTLAQMRDEYGIVYADWKDTATRDLLLRRFLDERERAALDKVHLRHRSDWLLGRIAVKDTVRHALASQGRGPLYPIEIGVEDDAQGRPALRGPHAGDLRISLAHKGGVAVAMVAEGRDIGIAIERIEQRSKEFEEQSFTDQERALLPHGPERDAWVARLWVAKEAAAKARGAVLEGDPRRFVVRELLGERLLVTVEGSESRKPGRVWVETRAEGQHVVGFTCK